MDVHAIEDRDGVRFSWNVWPSSRLEATRAVIPLSCMYTPLKQLPESPTLPYEPLVCRGPCKSIVSPSCGLDIAQKQWACPFCFTRNQFPPGYSAMTEQSLAAELIPIYSTVTYQLPRAVADKPPAYIFCVDTCLSDKQLDALKDQLLVSISLLPEDSLVGLITFGSTVQVHELAFDLMPKSFVFSAKADVPPKQVQDLLGIAALGASAASDPSQPQEAASYHNRFVLPVKDASFMFESTIEDLRQDAVGGKPNTRSARALGVALSVAVSLAGCSCPNAPARVQLFAGGPCTSGPGMVLGENIKEMMRSWHDLERENAPHTLAAYRHYAIIAQRAVANGHSIDVIACSLDQCGTYEMRDLASQTGGLMIQADGFETNVFKHSYARMLQRGSDHSMSFGHSAQIQVLCSRELKISGAIGNVSSLQMKNESVAEVEVGVGGTMSWRACSLDSDSTLGVYFDIVNEHSTPIPSGHKGVIQFQTRYRSATGHEMLRVTTVERPWADPSAGIGPIANGFDQEAAAVLLSRVAVYKLQTEEAFDVLRWLDRMLIRLVKQFANFQPNNPQSFQLFPNFTLFPQFMFHLRRSDFLQVHEASPDESTFMRYMLHRSNVNDSLVMIQPTLDAYTFDGPPMPVLLSATSLANDRILLLDTFFQIVIWHGKTIADWRNQKFHEQEEYAHLKQLLEAPNEDASLLLEPRFPRPRFIECDEGDSQSRFLVSVLDPDITHHTNPHGGSSTILTDDVSLEVFLQHLSRLAVSKDGSS